MQAQRTTPVYIIDIRLLLICVLVIVVLLLRYNYFFSVFICFNFMRSNLSNMLLYTTNHK